MSTPKADDQCGHPRRRQPGGISYSGSRWFARRGLAIPARRSAKWKTTIQGVALLLAVMPPLEDADLVVQACLWVAVAFTLVTGAQYLLDGGRATSATGSKSA